MTSASRCGDSQDERRSTDSGPGAPQAARPPTPRPTGPSLEGGDRAGSRWQRELEVLGQKTRQRHEPAIARRVRGHFQSPRGPVQAGHAQPLRSREGAEPPDGPTPTHAGTQAHAGPRSGSDPLSGEGTRSLYLPKLSGGAGGHAAWEPRSVTRRWPYTAELTLGSRDVARGAGSSGFRPLRLAGPGLWRPHHCPCPACVINAVVGTAPSLPTAEGPCENLWVSSHGGNTLKCEVFHGHSGSSISITITGTWSARMRPAPTCHPLWQP